MPSLAETLETERQRLGLSLNALAKAAGMSAGQLQRVLRGDTKNPGLHTVRAILKAMGRSLSWLEFHLDK